MLLGKKDESGGASGGKATDAATIICKISDLYTRSELDGKWRELVKVYEQRRNDDNLREILDLSAPNKRVNDLHGWHLERMAVGEYGGDMDAASGDVAVIRQDSRRVKQVLRTILADGERFRKRREEIVTAMVKQRDVLITELATAKEFLAQLHSADPEVVEMTTPALVEKRLLATVKPPEAAPDVDLSAAPSI